MPRLRFQFGLRMLFVAATVVAVIVSTLRVFTEHPPQVSGGARVFAGDYHEGGGPVFSSISYDPGEMYRGIAIAIDGLAIALALWFLIRIPLKAKPSRSRLRFWAPLVVLVVVALACAFLARDVATVARRMTYVRDSRYVIQPGDGDPPAVNWFRRLLGDTSYDFIAIPRNASDAEQDRAVATFPEADVVAINSKFGWGEDAQQKIASSRAPLVAFPRIPPKRFPASAARYGLRIND